MSLAVSLRYVREIAPGRFEFRRRIPQSVRARIGQGEFKRVFEISKESHITREHSRVMMEFEKLVSASGMGGSAQQVVSLEPVGAPAPKSDSVVCPAVPERTLEGARNLYLNDKLGKGVGPHNREGRVRLDRVFSRLEAALGKSASALALAGLKRDDARKVRDHMLQTKKRGGGTLSPESVKREMDILSAVITYALVEFELEDVVKNPFKALPIGNPTKDKLADIEKRDPLPDVTVSAVQDRLQGELLHIWRLLAGTGCRLAEVTGLRLEDIRIEGEAVPHMRVTWHEGRRLKTKASLRAVPLVGDALDAAKEARRVTGDGETLFPRYARPRGADAASAILMKHLRKVTTNPRHVVHSLRHSMKDRLREAGVEKTIQDIVLGHASSSIGEIYGSEAAKLTVAHRALLKVAT